VTGLTHAFSDALAPLRQRRAGHDPGRVLVDLAVMLADGGEAISDLAVLRDQPGLFGPVASTATAWRVLDAIDDQALAGLRQARASPGTGSGPSETTSVVVCRPRWRRAANCRGWCSIWTPA
jgi:hypothetical protein